MLSPQRRRELALKGLEYAILKDPLPLSPETRRDVGNAAKQLGVTREQLERLMQPLYQKVLNDAFPSLAKPCEVPTDDVSGDLAYRVLKRIISRRSIKLTPSVVRELGDVANTLKVPQPELLEFMQGLYQELLDDMFA